MLPADGGSGLFLPSVPEPPGDPASLTAAAGTFTAVHGSIERGHAVMTSAASQAGEVGWIGVGALAYGAATTDLTAAYQLTAGALARGAATLRGYAAALATAKETARHANAAVTATNATATRLLAAQDAADTAQDAADDASQTSATATAHATAHPHSPAAATTADQASRAAGDASNAATAAWHQVSVLSAQYDTDRATALRLGALARHQATAAATTAATGFDNATLGLIASHPRPVPGGARGADGTGTWDGMVEIIEGTHAALGAVGIDGILWGLGKGLDNAQEFMRDLPKLELEWLHRALPWGEDADDETWAAALHGWWTKADAAETFGQKFVDDTMALGTTARVLRGAGGPIAIAGDISTMINPAQAGTMGYVDRGAAAINAGAIGLDTVGAVGALAGWETVAALSLGPVGVGIAVGTGLYLAGSYAYKHFAWFRDDLANPVGHAFADAGQGVAHGIGHLGHDIMSLL